MKLRMFQLAKQMSLKSTGIHRLGCVIAKKNKVISRGFNTCYKTHPATPHPSQTLHAEIRAVLQAPTNLKGAVAYVYREHKNGDAANARPCETCQQVLRNLGIKTVYYTDSGSFKEMRLC